MSDAIEIVRLLSEGTAGTLQTIVLVVLAIWVWRADRILIKLHERIESLADRFDHLDDRERKRYAKDGTQ